MKYLTYILKHLRRNWIRTASTVLGMAVCIFLICTLQTVLSAVEYSLQAASASRLVTRHFVSLNFNLPLSYEPRIAAVPGVRRVAVSNWFGGVQGGATTGGESFRNFFTNLAVEAEPYLAMYPELQVPEDQKRAFMADMRGCIIGRALVERFGWQIGDTFQLESFIPPYRKREAFDFVVRGIYAVDRTRYPSFDDALMLFHFKYLLEGTGRQVGVATYVVELEDPDQAGPVSRAIDALFENSDAQTRTETEQAFFAGFMAMAGNLALLLNLIAVAVTFTILLVTANTMSMAVRERRTEIAVLKTLGFSSGLVMGLILAEATALGALGGGLGLLLAWTTVHSLGSLPAIGAIFGAYPDLGLLPGVATAAFGLALFLGLVAGLVPSALAYKARVTEMLRQV